MSGNALTYRDFTIEMTELEDDGTFRVRVIGQTPGGEMAAADAETSVYKQDELKQLLGKLDRRKSNADEIYELGAKLATLLLPGRVRALYERSLASLNEGEGLRLRLHIEPLPLAALPWEYTHLRREGGESSPGDFLALQRKVSIARYETIGSPLKPLQGKEKIKIVAVLASPMGEDELDVDADKRAIEAAIRDIQTKIQVVESLVLNAATRENLLKALPGCDIFHFAGHGTFEGVEMAPDGKILRKGRIILENEQNEADRYDSDQLAIALGNAGVRLAILGACNSASRDEGGAWSGVAPALARENIPAVVAMQYKVRDQNAALFMAFVYARVLGGYTIDEAVFEGRQAIFNQGGVLDRDWGVPVLYLRVPDGLLFPVPAAEPTSAEESPFVLVQREIGRVQGEDIGVEVADVVGGRIEVRDRIDTVEKGAKTIGVKIGQLGSLRSVSGGEAEEI